MRYVLFPIRSTKEGRKRGEYPLGTLCLREEGLEVEVPDRRISARIRQHFAEGYQVRKPFESADGVMAHILEKLEPGTPRHFDEGLRRLIRIDVLPIPEVDLG